MRREQFFIIEHPRRGTFKELDPNYGDPKFRFALTGARNDPEKCKLFSTLAEAWKMREKMPTPLKWECDILCYNYLEPSYYKLTRV